MLEQDKKLLLLNLLLLKKMPLMLKLRELLLQKLPQPLLPQKLLLKLLQPLPLSEPSDSFVPEL